MSHFKKIFLTDARCWISFLDPSKNIIDTIMITQCALKSSVSMRFKHQSILLLLLCSVGCAGAFLARGACLRGCKARDGPIQLNVLSEVSERTSTQQLSTSDLAREWAARNGGSSDSIRSASLPASPDSVSTSSTTAAPPPESSSSKPTASSYTDLALEWAERNRDSNTIYGSLSNGATSSSSIDSIQAQIPSPTDSTTQLGGSEMPDAVIESFDFPAVLDTERRIDIVTSVDKELWLDEETGRFYEAPSSDTDSSESEVDPIFEQISTPKRFAANHGGLKDLQKQIDARNTVVEGEGRYAVADGELVGTLTSDEINKAVMAELSVNDELSDEERQMFAAQIEALVKPRPYSLFLAEKAAEFVESSAKGLCKPFKGTKNKPLVRVTKGKRLRPCSRRQEARRGPRLWMGRRLLCQGNRHRYI